MLPAGASSHRSEVRGQRSAARRVAADAAQNEAAVHTGGNGVFPLVSSAPPEARGSCVLVPAQQNRTKQDVHRRRVRAARAHWNSNVHGGRRRGPSITSNSVNFSPKFINITVTTGNKEQWCLVLFIILIFQVFFQTTALRHLCDS